MEFEIIETKNQTLYVYQNDDLMFYSKLKWNWLKRDVITIFDENDEIVIEFQSFAVFFMSKFKVLKQNNKITNKISKISDSHLSYGKDKKIERQIDNYFSFNLNFSYFCNKRKIAEVKQKLYSFPQKILINIDVKNIEFRNAVLIHILAIRTGYSHD